MVDAPVAPPVSPAVAAASTITLPPELAMLLTQVKPVQPLAPYTTCTHAGKSFALVLPDGDGDLVLLASPRPSREEDKNILSVHGIAASQGDRPSTQGRKLKVRVLSGLVEFFHQSQEARSDRRLTMKDTSHAIDAPIVTTIGQGQSIDFMYVMGQGWKQV